MGQKNMNIRNIKEKIEAFPLTHPNVALYISVVTLIIALAALLSK